jgi:hypothetical protein
VTAKQKLLTVLRLAKEVKVKFLKYIRPTLAPEDNRPSSDSAHGQLVQKIRSIADEVLCAFNNTDRCGALVALNELPASDEVNGISEEFQEVYDVLQTFRQTMWKNEQSESDIIIALESTLEFHSLRE